MGCARGRLPGLVGERSSRPMLAMCLVTLLLLGAHKAYADEATEWLSRAAVAAKQLNYSGVYVYQHGEHVEVM